jgi:hypothetical protein
MADADPRPGPADAVVPTDGRFFVASRYDGPASPTGAYVTGLGAVIVLVAVWLPWVATGPDDSGRTMTGYECDSVIPLVGFLGLSMTAALLVATARADRRQHRGLSLTSMAVGMSWTAFTAVFYLHPSAGGSTVAELRPQYGLLVSFCGAVIWMGGSYLLAREPEGDYLPISATPPTAGVTDRNGLDVSYPVPGSSPLPPMRGGLADRGMLDDSGTATLDPGD